eukprot:6131241-Amphidinium_carterae.2
MDRIRRRGASLEPHGFASNVLGRTPLRLFFPPAVIEDQWWIRQIEDHVWASRQKRTSSDAVFGNVADTNSTKKRKERMRPVSRCPKDSKLVHQRMFAESPVVRAKANKLTNH